MGVQSTFTVCNIWRTITVSVGNQSIQSLYDLCESWVHFSEKSQAISWLMDWFKDSISAHSQQMESVQFVDISFSLCQFCWIYQRVNSRVYCDSFSVKCLWWRSAPLSVMAMAPCQTTVEYSLQDSNKLMPQLKQFEYLGLHEWR